MDIIINKIIIYKPNRKTKIELKYTCKNNYQKKLLKLQSVLKTDLLPPITIQLKHDTICIIYDEEKLNGFGFNEKEVKDENNGN